MGIIACIAIPIYRSNTRKGYEASAVSSLKLMINGETTARSGGSFVSLKELHNRGVLDDSFLDDDGNDATLKKHGYIFQVTTDGTSSLVISAIPQNSSVFDVGGSYRFGIDSNGTMGKDRQNLTNHFTAPGELRSGTAVDLDSN